MAKQKPSQRLALLLKLAAQREQTAARALAASTEREQQARQQASQLAEYSDEYAQRQMERARQAVTARELANFQRFYGQLDRAQQQQIRVVQQLEQERESARQRWLSLNARQKLLEQLRAKRLAVEEIAAEKRRQRELDDRPRLNNSR